MTTWQNAQDAVPELAAAVQERFESTGLGFLATLRRDGAPRISGRAVEVEDQAEKQAFSKHLAQTTEFDPEAHGPFHLFKLDIAELYFLKPAGDHLDIQWWTPDGGHRQVDRY